MASFICLTQVTYTAKAISPSFIPYDFEEGTRKIFINLDNVSCISCDGDRVQIKLKDMEFIKVIETEEEIEKLILMANQR